MFDELTKSSCKDFLTNVNQAKKDWIKEPEKCDCTQSIIHLTNLHTNYTPTGHWTKDEEDNNAKITALATALHHEQTKNENRPKKSTTTGVQPVLEPWKFLQDWKINNVNGVKYVLCKEYGRKDKNVKKIGMYMTTPYDYSEWLTNKFANRNAWKDKNKKSNLESQG